MWRVWIRRPVIRPLAEGWGDLSMLKRVGQDGWDECVDLFHGQDHLLSGCVE